MSTSFSESPDSPLHGDVAPGDDLSPADIPQAIRGYLIGLALATLLTGVSFFVARSTLVWQPSIPIALKPMNRIMQMQH